jgi:hypothetical protein
MSGDNYTIQELGGAELARHYPDQGVLPDSNWYNAIVRLEPQVAGFVTWLRSFQYCSGFMAVLSASSEGLRIVVLADQFTLFIPWTETIVSSERGQAATIVHLKTAAVPSLTLLINVSDAAADDLFQKVVEPLPRREPARRLFWRAAD